MDEVEHFFWQFPNPWALRVSGMGCYTSKCEKSQNHCTLLHILHHACVGVDEQQEPCGDGEGGGDHPLFLFLAALAHHPLKADLLQP